MGRRRTEPQQCIVYVVGDKPEEPMLCICEMTPAENTDGATFLVHDEDTGLWRQAYPMNVKPICELITCANCKHFDRASDFFEDPDLRGGYCLKGKHVINDILGDLPSVISETEEDNHCKWAEKKEEGE